MITPWPAGRLLAILGLLVLLGVLIGFSNVHSWPSTHDIKLPSAASTGISIGLNTIKNGTLGFEKILVIHLPERSDKRDALDLSASFTGLDLTYVESVKGFEMVAAARPFDYEAHELKNNTWGSWRGHMNAVRAILDRNLASALIFEDDIDWDVNLKSQAQNFAHGSRWLTSTKAFPTDRSYANATSFLDASTGIVSIAPDIPTPDSHPQISSPYGSNWDVLWLGHCGEGTRHDDSRIFKILNDLTVPPLSFFVNHWGRGFDPGQIAPPHTRFVHASRLPVCTFAYAVSRAGAQKLLYYASVSGLLGNTFDVALGEMCRHKTLGLECLSVNPPLFMNFQRRGPKNFESDSDPDHGEGEVREKDAVKNIVYSVRLNTERLLTGREPVAQDWTEQENKGEGNLTNPYDIGSPLSRDALDGFH